MNGRSLMQAVVAIRPDLSDFRRDTERTVKRTAKQAGDTLEDGIEDGGRDGAKAAGKHIEKEFDRSTSAAASNFQSKMKSASAGLAKAGGVMTAAVSAPLALLGKRSVEAFSDLNETVSFSSDLFGGNLEEMERWAEGGARAFGMSKRQALDAASTFGIFGQAAGKTGEEVAAFSQEFTELASDMASARNTTIDDAVLALGAALRGEMEPIRRYGIMLDDATLKAQAMELGIYDGEGALTQQQKVLASHGLIVQKAFDNKFIGNFQATADDLANSMRITEAIAENTAASFGNDLAPVVDRVVDKLAAFLEWFSELSPRTKKAILILGAITAVLGPLLLLFGAMAASIIAITAALPALGAAFAVMTGPIGLVVAAIALISAAVWVFRDDIWDAIKWVGRKFEDLSAWLVRPFVEWRDTLSGIWTSVVDGVKDLVNTYIGIWERGLNALGGAVNGSVVAAINWVSPGDPVPEIPQVSLPRLATGGTVYPDGRVDRGTLAVLGDGGEPEDVVPHSKRDAYVAAHGQQPLVMNVTINGASFDERRLVAELDRLSRTAAATTARPRRLR